MSNIVKPVLLDETGARMATALERIADGLGRVTLTITMVSTNGAAVHDENLVVTDIATGSVMYTIPYVGTPIQIELPQGKSYSITGTQVNLATTKFYNPAVINGIAQSDSNITVTYDVLDEANSLVAIQTAIQAHPGVEILPIGTEVTVPWTAENGIEYDNVLVLVHYGYFVKESDKDTGKLTWMAIFMNKFATVASLQFDHPEQEEATETQAASGLYYYGVTGNTWTLLELAQGDPVPYGDYDHVYHNEIRDTTFNAMKNGYNRWSHSAYRQYLNSDAGLGEWWTPQHVGDTAPTELNSYRGYMAGFRALDLQAVQSIQIVTALNTVTDAALGTLETTYDKFWLPSIKEMYGVEQLAGEGDAWPEYWHDEVGMAAATNDTDALRKIFALNAQSSAQSCRLRSCYRGSSSSVWYVYASGSLSYSYASNSYRSAPACAIG